MFNKDYVTDYFSHTDSSLWCLLYACVSGEGILKGCFSVWWSPLLKRDISNFPGNNVRGPKHNAETDETDLHGNYAVL